MFLTLISPYVPYILLSTFIKCIALLIIAVLTQLCLRKLSSNLKHMIWLTILFSVVLMPLSSFVIPPDIFLFEIKSGSSSGALHIFDAVLPRYNAIGIQIQSASGMVSAAAMMQSPGPMLPWEVVCVIFWLTGIVCSLARVIVGKFGINKILNDARVIENSSIIDTLEFVAKEFRISRNVQVLQSTSCRVPFTYGTFKPVILLPSGATKWPSERLRSVMIHELAHVKRFDSFTLLFARIVCALFWFIPIVWIAYRHLYIEQEKTCDEDAVHTGIEAERYVRHILNVVRFARGRGRVLLTGIFFLRGKRKMLEKRILHLLKHDALKFISRKKVFIAAAVLCFFVLFPVLVFNPMYAEDGAKRISEKEFWNTFSGVWVNTEHYLGIERWQPQKLIIHTDGKFGYYLLTTDTDPVMVLHPFDFTKAWIDSEGVVWYKGILKEPYTIYILGRITDSGNTLELIGDGINNPTEWDTSKVRYSEYEIRYRQ
jgi:beta-lactamase regulating signal transducer with metallopeptidase domain